MAESVAVAIAASTSRRLRFLKELRILRVCMCFGCLLMIHGVITIVLPYDELTRELDIINVCELEDFLINECMYTVGLSPIWNLFLSELFLALSDNLLVSIQEKIKWVDTTSELDKKHKKDCIFAIKSLGTCVVINVKSAT
ncbi:hypothetical protein K2173_010574 [Erythroxylum novogranatense]|uniref:Uncharacterized protein n=1 Tax=Erythroxylum novogranatense TaxID=1862640 RepID=A0AAV8TFA5_9ROSI|nr:hypothetical protein K2173_010574 [Erythroxylum novogranatense]